MFEQELEIGPVHPRTPIPICRVADGQGTKCPVKDEETAAVGSRGGHLRVEAASTGQCARGKGQKVDSA